MYFVLRWDDLELVWKVYYRATNLPAVLRVGDELKAKDVKFKVVIEIFGN